MNAKRLIITAALLLTTVASVGTTVYVNSTPSVDVNNGDQPDDPNAASVIL